MDIFSLRCFVEVVRTGGFSRAAERVGRTQPAISAQIKSLEELCGGPLFDRSTSRPSLTARGRSLLPRAEKLVADFDALVQVLSGEGEPVGPVTLASGQSLIDHLLPPVLGRLRGQHPGIRLKLLNRNFEGLERALAEGEADLALGWFETVPERWEARPLASFRFVGVAPAGRRALTALRLLAGPLVTFEQGNSTRQWLEARLGPLASALELTSTSSILQYVERGFGGAVVPEYVLGPSRRRRLAVVDLPALPECRLYLAWRRGAELSPAARLVEVALAAELG